MTEFHRHVRRWREQTWQENLFEAIIVGFFIGIPTCGGIAQAISGVCVWHETEVIRWVGPCCLGGEPTHE